MSTDSKSHVPSPVFHAEPHPVQVSVSTASNIITSLSDTVNRLSDELCRVRQDATNAHYALGQATQQHFQQYADVSGQRTVLQNQVKDCYTNIVGLLNLAAGYTQNIGVFESLWYLSFLSTDLIAEGRMGLCLMSDR